LSKYCSCSCQWGETISPNCDQQRAYFPSPRSYVSMESHCGITSTGKTNSHSRSCGNSNSHLVANQEDHGKGNAKFYLKSISFRTRLTERRVRVVHTPTSYSGGAGFNSLPRRPAIPIQVFRGFPQSLKVNAGIVP
jgi:hypothetical protein